MEEDQINALEAFFEIFDPPRVPNSAALLKKFGEPLFAKLDEKYNAKFFYVRAELKKILETHDPGNTKANVDRLLVSKPKRELAVLELFKKKYGLASPKAANNDADDFHKATETFFKLYDPSSVAKTAAYCTKFADRKKDLHTSLGKKYQKQYFVTRETVKGIIRGSGDTTTDIDDFLYEKLRDGAPDESVIGFAKTKYMGKGGGQQQPSYKTRLEAMFKKYSPERAHLVDGLLTKHKGDEERLVQSLVQKFGPEPAAKPIQTPPPLIEWEKRFRDLYSVYEPSKVGNETALMQKYAGKEVDVWKMLVKRYGPEPLWVERIERLLKSHGVKIINTENITQKLVEFAGKEDDLLAAYVQRYGPEEADTTTTTAGSGSSGTPITLTAKIYRLYYHKCRERVDTVPTLLEKFKENLEGMYEKLQEKYGEDEWKAQPKETEYERRLVNIYAVHAPEKLTNVPNLLAKYPNNEPALIKTILQKYSLTAEPDCGGNNNTPQLTHRERVVNMFEAYDKPKLAQIDDFLTRYEGQETELIQALIKRYGPEPPPRNASQVQEERRRRVRLCYRRFKPFEYDIVHEVLKEWDGREQELLDVLLSEYGEVEEEDTYQQTGEMKDPTRRALQIKDDEAFEARHKAEGEGVFSQLLHLQRTSRWRIEDDFIEISYDLFEVEEDLCVKAKQKEIQRHIGLKSKHEHLKIAFRRWMGFLAIRLQVVCSARNSMLNSKLSVYDQMQTNKYSIAAHKRQKKTHLQRQKRVTKQQEKDQLTREVHLSFERNRSQSPLRRSFSNNNIRRQQSPANDMESLYHGYGGGGGGNFDDAMSLYGGVGAGYAPTERAAKPVGGNKAPYFAKSAAELRMHAEEKKRQKQEHDAILTAYSRPEESLHKGSIARDRSGSGQRSARRVRMEGDEPDPREVPSTPRRRNPRKTTAHSPTYHEHMDATVSRAYNEVSNAYPDPDADMYAQVIQQVTGTPETKVEQGMRERRQQALQNRLDFLEQ